MRLLAAALVVGLFSFSAGDALAQACPTPSPGSDGFWSIKLPTVELRLRPGQTSADLILSALSPVTGETETQRATVVRDGPVSERAALLQVNRYDLNPSTLQVTAAVTAVLAAGYTPSGALNIGYGAQEGGFLVLIDGDTISTGCYEYPQNAAFGDWTKAISLIGFDVQILANELTTSRAELNQCRSQRLRLEEDVASLESANSSLRTRVLFLEAELEKTKLAASRRIFDLRFVIRQIFNEAQDGVKRRYPGDRQALMALRKQLVVARKANRRNVARSSNVIEANRTSVR